MKRFILLFLFVFAAGACTVGCNDDGPSTEPEEQEKDKEKENEEDKEEEKEEDGPTGEELLDAALDRFDEQIDKLGGVLLRCPSIGFPFPGLAPNELLNIPPPSVQADPVAYAGLVDLMSDLFQCITDHDIRDSCEPPYQCSIALQTFEYRLMGAVFEELLRISAPHKEYFASLFPTCVQACSATLDGRAKDCDDPNDPPEYFDADEITELCGETCAQLAEEVLFITSIQVDQDTCIQQVEALTDCLTGPNLLCGPQASTCEAEEDAIADACPDTWNGFF